MGGGGGNDFYHKQKTNASRQHIKSTRKQFNQNNFSIELTIKNTNKKILNYLHGSKVILNIRQVHRIVIFYPLWVD